MANASSLPKASAHRGILALINFCAGAAIMVIEITANRLLAPYFGNSIYTWTSLIGVVLISLSVGAYLGGRWADKQSRPDLLAWLLAGSGFLTLLIPVIGLLLGPQLASAGLIAGPVLISLLIFTLPGILLGAVSPASVRFYAEASGEGQVGQSAGVISMLGSLGSFVGTFLSGFVLLSFFGVKSIFVVSAIILFLLAGIAFYMAKSLKKNVLQISTLAVISSVSCALINEPIGASVIHQQESFYHRIRVIDEPIQGRPARTLYLDSTTEGGIYLEKQKGLPLHYQNFWRILLLQPDIQPQRALFIGAGAFGMPTEVSELHPQMQVDVAEIDPQVVEVGRQFFRLNDFPRVAAHAVDGRRFVQTTSHRYDLIFGDAYNGIRHIPAHLVTQEFFREIHSCLTEKGVFMMNLISAVQGPQSELLKDILTTVRSVFPHVEVFDSGAPPQQAQNLILVASNRSWDFILKDRYFAAGSQEKYFQDRHLSLNSLPSPGRILTDDLNPIDAIIARQLRQ